MTKSTPDGAIDHPINPVRAAIAAEATWVGRAYDADTKHLPDLVERMAKHKGVSFLEVFQNCNIFNDGAFDHYTSKDVRGDRILYVEPGQPLRFGADQSKGIVLDGRKPRVVTLGENGVTEKDLLVYDATDQNLAYMISNLDVPEFPVPMGVFLDIERPTYEDLLGEQIQKARKRATTAPDLQQLVQGRNTWTVG